MRGISALWLFFFLVTPYGMWDLVAHQGIKPMPSLLDCQGSPALVSFMVCSGRQ